MEIVEVVWDGYRRTAGYVIYRDDEKIILSRDDLLDGDGTFAVIPFSLISTIRNLIPGE